MARNGTVRARREAKEAARKAAEAAEREAAMQANYDSALSDGCRRLAALNPGLTEGQVRAAVVRSLAAYYPDRKV